MNNGAHSSVVESPRRNSAQSIYLLHVLNGIRILAFTVPLEETRIVPPERYFSVIVNRRVLNTDSLTSLHSGARDADILILTSP